MKEAEILNREFGIAGEVLFKEGDLGALVCEIRSASGNGTITVQGAQILSWAPAGQTPVVWLSPAARFAPGKSMRGGAPVCWPWFGPHSEDPAKPAHGFARNRDWDVREVASLTEGTRVVMGFAPNDAERAIWPYDAELMLAVTLGERLRFDLTTRNLGGESISITQAIHTYFQVGDIGSVRVEGLEGCEYVDKTGSNARVHQEGPILIDREVNRIYLGCPGDAIIVDESLGRRIRVTKQGSTSYVVWNPWAETAAKFGDMGQDGYRHMLCVETTNAATDAVTIAPGETYTLSTEYAIEPLQGA
jgi:glucose-6-phosphate 1-epimerase